MFSLYFGKDGPLLTYNFQLGWNHHLASHGDLCRLMCSHVFFSLRHRYNLFIRTFPATWDGDAKKKRTLKGIWMVDNLYVSTWHMNFLNPCVQWIGVCQIERMLNSMWQVYHRYLGWDSPSQWDCECLYVGIRCWKWKPPDNGGHCCWKGRGTPNRYL